MKAIFKKPGHDAEVIDILNTLEALQERIGGSIETVGCFADACVICDEEWRFKYYGTQVICGMLFGGPILIVGTQGEEFTDLPQPEVVKELIWPSQRGRER